MFGDAVIRPTGKTSVFIQASRPTCSKVLTEMSGAAKDGGIGVAVLCGPVGLYCTSRLAEVPAACMMLSGSPATVTMQSREPPVLFALTVIVTCPLPVPLAGDTVIQLGQGLSTVQLQFKPLSAVTFTFVLPPLAPSDPLLADSEKVQGLLGSQTTWSTQPWSCPPELAASLV